MKDSRKGNDEMHDPALILAINKVLQEYMRVQGLHVLAADKAAELVYEAGVFASDEESPHVPGSAFRDLIRDLRKEYGYEALHTLVGAKQAHNQPGGHYTLHRFEPPTREAVNELLATMRAAPDKRKNHSDGDVMPDHLQEGLDVVFVSLSGGSSPAGDQHYYSDPHDRFWDLVNESELVSDIVGAENDHLILDEKCGLVDLTRKKASGTGLEPEEFDVDGFTKKMERYKPKAVAFIGKRAYREVFKRDPKDYGLADDIIGDSYVFMLPSSSGTDTSMTHQQKLHWYKKLKGILRTL